MSRTTTRTFTTRFNSVNILTIVSKSASQKMGCSACKDGIDEPFPFTMAFQPIVDTSSQTVFAYEALVRGPNRESAVEILRGVTSDNRYAFDQSCRTKAITLAAKLRIPQSGARLSVNFMPGAVDSPSASIQQTLRVAYDNDFPLDMLIFEITEDERVHDATHLQKIITEYKRHGFAIGIDDFGDRCAGLNMFAELAVDFVKLDACLVRGIHLRPRTEAVVRAIVHLSFALNVRVIAECVETLEEYERLRECGVSLMQGYLFAKPRFEELPEVTWPENAVSLNEVSQMSDEFRSYPALGFHSHNSR